MAAAAGFAIAMIVAAVADFARETAADDRRAVAVSAPAVMRVADGAASARAAQVPVQDRGLTLEFSMR